jgi:hypothetical protein
VPDVSLPLPAPQLTFYARFGDWALAALLVFAAVLTALVRRAT